jgi:hypothetical protein
MPTPKVLDPKSLLGNPLRTAPAPGKSSAVPLNLDEAMNRSPLPGGIPYPYDQSAHLIDPSKILANEQANLDYRGVVLPFMNYMSCNNLRRPDTDKLQTYATTSEVTFEYDGVVYKHGGYVPG